MGRIIGIDLGTTNSLAAYWENGESRLIPNALGDYLTPSVISIDEDGTVYVGKTAKEKLISHPDRTVSVFKRSMGTDREYQIGGPGGKKYRSEELSALVLRRLKEDAEEFLGEEVEEAIISVPAYFGDLARKATRNAGQIAGLRVERIINEPSAAALACQHIRRQQEAKMLVYDFGGGTLDVSLVECVDNVIEITAVSGNNHLGGSDFDRMIAEYFCKEHHLQFISLSKYRQEIILRSAEKAKRKLTVSEETVMNVSDGEFQGELMLTRKDLIRISGKIFQKMAAPVKRVLSDAKVGASELNQVVLVGGSCKMPVVQQYLKYMLKDVDMVTADPDYMVAIGTGVYAGIKERSRDIRDMVLTDICPFSLGTGVFNQSDNTMPYMNILIARNSPLPISCERTYFTVSDNQKSMSVRVYQGEDIYVKNNLYLGGTEVSVPPAPAGKQKMLVRFTYDINGLLVVDLYVPSTGEKKQMVFENGVSTEPDEVMKSRIKKLEKLKVPPREEAENHLLLSRAEAIYAQLWGEPKFRLEQMLKEFNYLLNGSSKVKIKKAAKLLKQYLDIAEAQYLDNEKVEDDVAAFQQWYEELEEEDTQEEMDNWGNLYYTS